jgi:putative DNA methylase
VTASYRKKLIEVALPLKAIYEADSLARSIWHGLQSPMRICWALREQAAYFRIAAGKEVPSR